MAATLLQDFVAAFQLRLALDIRSQLDRYDEQLQISKRTRRCFLQELEKSLRDSWPSDGDSASVRCTAACLFDEEVRTVNSNPKGRLVRPG